MELSKKDIIISSWHILKNHLVLMVTIVLFIFSLNILISIIQEKQSGDITYQTMLFVMATYLFQTGLSLGFLRICLNMINKSEVNFQMLFSSFHMLIPYVLTTILYLIALLLVASPGLFLLYRSVSSNMDNLSRFIGSTPAIIGIILAIIPTIYLSIRLQFYEYFLIDEECGIIESIKKSGDIAKGHVLELFVLGAALSLIILVSIIPMGVGLLFTIPLSKIAMSYVYMMLKRNS